MELQDGDSLIAIVRRRDMFNRTCFKCDGGVYEVIEHSSDSVRCSESWCGHMIPRYLTKADMARQLMELPE